MINLDRPSRAWPGAAAKAHRASKPVPGRSLKKAASLLLAAPLLLVGCGGGSSGAAPAVLAAPVAPKSAEAACMELQGQTFEGAVVAKAQFFPTTGAVPENCLVRGEMPKDLAFEVRMPTVWNHRTVFMGGGGFDGVITASAYSPGVAEGGYATIATNHGHTGSSLEGSFALDADMLNDYAYLAVARVLPAAKAIMKARLGSAEVAGAKMVYEGCSGGGRQGLIQAQRYPDAFDGVISRAPANAYTPQFLYYQKQMKQLAKPGAALSKAKVQTIANAVMDQCDGLDGLKDNVIGRPDLCTFNLSALKCTGAESNSCLTDTQLESARTMYESTSVAGGRYTWPGFPFGGETADPARLQAWGGPGPTLLGGDFMKYFVAQSATADPLQIDPAQYTSRLDYLVGLIDAVNPDLSQFRAHGGKLLLWHGLTDWLITPHNTTDYYNKVIASAGGQATADQFVEYYQAPGVDHCANGLGVGQGADRVDLVGPMFDWIEKGVKPSSKKIVATNSLAAPGTKAMQRPLCKYPQYAKYNGSGDPDAESSFICTAP
ncbi:tannase/feruloyl esterase family alpha/beta hydrolase [Variovorax sp. Varisp36]|uniref:tannase/feruloyl esterase family alpha/beta hydrolase n=1 Tax=Variovorax sp. Varisp36 TaxID=3243031 RepID=UPI0039A6DADB